MDDAAPGRDRERGGAQFESGDLVAERYKVVRFIARGGMGEVYEVEDTALATRVALKSLRAHLASDDSAAERFRREILLARQVTHPNVCRIFDLATHRTDGGNLPVLTMELLGGATLAARLRRGGPMPEAAVLDTLRQIAAGMSEAHRRGIVHRDLKSANIILEDAGGGATRVVITDFGLARSLGTGESHVSVAGTPAYMAPEQIAGGAVGPATDVYALGVVLYEMMTGRPVVDLEGKARTAADIKADAARGLPGYPAAWSRAVVRCLAFDPVDRFGAMDEMLAALGGGAAPANAAALLALGAGDFVGKRRVLSRLAPGVYRARDTAAGRSVVVEVVTGVASPTVARLRKLEEELRALGERCPGLPPLVELAVHEGALLVVLDLPEGRTVRERLEAGPLTPAQVVRLAARLTATLAEVHAHGVVLGGLSPDGVIVTRDDRPLLLGVGPAMARPSAGSGAAAGDVTALGQLLARLEAAATATRGRRWLPRALGGIALAAVALAIVLIAARRVQRATPAETHVDYQTLTFDRGIVTNARFAEDGRTIVYSSALDGEKPRVYLHAPGSAETRPLSEPGFDLLALSSGGELALRRWDAGSTVLSRMSMAGAAPRDVSEHVWLADWTRGGEMAAVRVLPDPRRRVIELPLGTEIYTTPLSISSLRVAPDGERVAFAEHPINGDEAGRVVVMSAAGARTEASPLYTAIHGVAWGWRRGEILYAAVEEGGKNGLFATTPGGEVRRLLALPYSGTLLDAGDGRVLLTMEDTNVLALLAVPGEERPRNLSWLDYSMVTAMSIDGTRLLICEGMPTASDDYETFLRPTDGGPAIKVGRGFGVQISPDGRWVLSFAREGNGHHLMLLPTGAGPARELPRGPLTVYNQNLGGFTPDGKRVVFVAKAAGNWRIWEQQIDDGVLRPVSDEGTRLAGPATVTPDGRRLLALDPKGQPVLLDLTGGGGASVPVAGFVPGMTLARFTPDGQRLWVTRRDGRQLVLEQLDVTTGARVEHRRVTFDGALWSTTAVTPDGETMAYSVRFERKTLFEVSGL